MQLWSLQRAALSPTLPAVHLSVESGDVGAVESVTVVAKADSEGASLGYAQAVHRPGGWSLEVVLDARIREEPGTADSSIEVREALVRAVLDEASSRRSDKVTLWEAHPTEDHDAVAERTELTQRRDLLQMRRPLPVDAPWSLAVRPFVVGQDEEAWLKVNGRAFADHPEQGAWDRAALEQVLSEPWFDAAGFLMHEVDGRLAGFCWTKIHPDERPPLGEIFVIAVDPDFASQGLGRQLTLAGLDHLCQQGLTVGMLYVDASNKAALRMYENLGFVVDHIRRGYSRPS